MYCGNTFYPREGKEAYYKREDTKRNSQKVDKVLFSSDFIQMIKKGNKDEAIKLYTKQSKVSLEESEAYISALESKKTK